MKINKNIITSTVLSSLFAFSLSCHSAYGQASRTPVSVNPAKPIPLPAPRFTPRPAPRPAPRPVPFPRPTPVLSNYAKIDIKHQLQEPNLCAPTSASMMLSKFGWNYPPRQIKLASLGLPYYGPSTPFNYWTGINMKSLLKGLSSIGINSWKHETYSLGDFQKGLDDIKNSIRRGYPVMLLVWYSPRHGHAMVVSGFDDVKQRLIVNDPGRVSPGIDYHNYADLRDKLWKNVFSIRNVVFMYQTNPTQSRTMSSSIATEKSMELVY
jgi:hypothetical protein